MMNQFTAVLLTLLLLILVVSDDNAMLQELHEQLDSRIFPTGIQKQLQIQSLRTTLTFRP